MSPCPFPQGMASRLVQHTEVLHRAASCMFGIESNPCQLGNLLLVMEHACVTSETVVADLPTLESLC